MSVSRWIRNLQQLSLKISFGDVLNSIAEEPEYHKCLPDNQYHCHLRQGLLSVLLDTWAFACIPSFKENIKFTQIRSSPTSPVYGFFYRNKIIPARHLENSRSQQKLLIKKLGWRNVSVHKITGCSFRILEFNLQHLHIVPSLSIITLPGDSIPSSSLWEHQMWTCTQTYMKAKPWYTWNEFSN